ncbi:hypothetical protein COCNU_scaffold001568G000010 [Cocos nucifera]|nr:hypothetical protein [Cocos nucifera]
MAKPPASSDGVIQLGGKANKGDHMRDAFLSQSTYERRYDFSNHERARDAQLKKMGELYQGTSGRFWILAMQAPGLYRYPLRLDLEILFFSITPPKIRSESDLEDLQNSFEDEQSSFVAAQPSYFDRLSLI